MIDISLLDQFKDAYLTLLKQHVEDLNKDDLYLAEEYSLVQSIQDDVKNLNLSIEFFFNAKENRDELAIQAALLRISTFLLGIQGAIHQTIEDIDRFAKIASTADFPEDYKIPEHYKYPIK